MIFFCEENEESESERLASPAEWDPAEETYYFLTALKRELHD